MADDELDQISMHAEVDEELALLRERLAFGARRSTGPFGIPLTCAWRHGRPRREACLTESAL